MPNRFPELLAALLRRSGGMSAQALGDQTGVSQSTMSRVSRGQVPPDLDKLEAWAEVLGLTGEERDDFLLAGQLAHCPRPIVDLIERMDEERDAALRRIAALEEAVLILKGEAPRADPAAPRSLPRAR